MQTKNLYLYDGENKSDTELDILLAIWKDQAMPFHPELQHATRTSVQHFTGRISSFLFRIQVHLKCSGLKSLWFRSWLSSQLSCTYLWHMSSWSVTRSHLIEPRNQLQVLIQHFIIKSDMNLKRWLNSAPKALLICTKIHQRLNLLP